MGRRKGSQNKFRLRKRDGAKIAHMLLERPAYRKSLCDRLDKGTAGPIEVLLWQYRCGLPKQTTDLNVSGVAIAPVHHHYLGIVEQRRQIDAFKKSVEAEPIAAIPKKVTDA